MITFFVVEASCQTATALGFAVLEIPDDARLSDGGAELSADVTSSNGEPLEGVVCVVDLKVIQYLLQVANVCVHAGVRHFNCTRAGSTYKRPQSRMLTPQRGQALEKRHVKQFPQIICAQLPPSTSKI